MRAPAVQQSARAARLDDFAARFVASGVRFFEPRFLGLVTEPGACAHGLLVQMTEADWEAMTGHEWGYDLRVVTVLCQDEPVQAQALVLRDSERVAEGWPSRRYARILIEGAEPFDLPSLQAFRQAEARGSAITLWLAVPIRLLLRYAPWLGVRGIVAVITALPVLAGIVVLWWLT